jgi:hypothetical protein
MKNPSHATTLAIAAIVFVVLPLLANISVLAANFALESTGTTAVLGNLGTKYVILVGWSFLATALVGALVATVLRQQSHA